jgi:hypothetical protein
MIENISKFLNAATEAALKCLIPDTSHPVLQTTTGRLTLKKLCIFAPMAYFGFPKNNGYLLKL